MPVTFLPKGTIVDTGYTVYVAPDYLIEAAQRKYGMNIYVLGTMESDLNTFWNAVEAKAYSFNENDFPKQVARTIVDITAKEHCNYGNNQDKMQVKTRKEEMEGQKRSYSLSFGKETGWKFGGNVSVGHNFFNVANVGFGIGGSISRRKWMKGEKNQENEASLSKGYGVSGEIDVPPKTKVTVTIATYAVTYKLGVKVVFNVPVSALIQFYYTTPYVCGCFYRTRQVIKIGYILAQELFQNENEFQLIGGTYVQFTRGTELSYLSETAEMRKEQTPL